MQLGEYDIPEFRLDPDGIRDIKKIYDEIKKGEIHTNDLAKMLNYSAPNSGKFYSRLSSLTDYGLLEGRGRYRVTQLGREISYPVGDDSYKKELYKTAVLNVPLWKAIHERYPDKIPENFWYVLKEITNVEAPDIHKVEKEIKKWYLEDIALIPLDSSKSDDRKSFSLENSNMQQHMSYPQPQELITAPSVDTGRLALNINNQNFNMPIFNKTSLKLAVEALKMLGEPFGIEITTKDVKPKPSDDASKQNKQEEQEQMSPET